MNIFILVLRDDFKLVIKLMKFAVFSIAILAIFGEKKFFRLKKIWFQFYNPHICAIIIFSIYKCVIFLKHFTNSFTWSVLQGKDILRGYIKDILKQNLVKRNECPCHPATVLQPRDTISSSSTFISNRSHLPVTQLRIARSQCEDGFLKRVERLSRAAHK